MSKKQYDDTELEYYGLTEEDLEKIRNEWDFIDGDIMLDALKLSSMFYALWYELDLDDILKLLEKNRKNAEIPVNFW